jgi:acetyl esterase/lipase
MGGGRQYARRPAFADADRRLPPATLRTGTTHRVWGRQFNGLSQAQAFGEELQAAQNHPLARIQNKASGHVFNARTHDHSSMSVATGIPSEPVTVSIAAE